MGRALCSGGFDLDAGGVAGAGRGPVAPGRRHRHQRNQARRTGALEVQHGSVGRLAAGSEERKDQERGHSEWCRISHPISRSCREQHHPSGKAGLYRAYSAHGFDIRQWVRAERPNSRAYHHDGRPEGFRRTPARRHHRFHLCHRYLGRPRRQRRPQPLRRSELAIGRAAHEGRIRTVRRCLFASVLLQAAFHPCVGFGVGRVLGRKSVGQLVLFEGGLVIGRAVLGRARLPGCFEKSSRAYPAEAPRASSWAPSTKWLSALSGSSFAIPWHSTMAAARSPFCTSVSATRRWHLRSFGCDWIARRNTSIASCRWPERRSISAWRMSLSKYAVALVAGAGPARRHAFVRLSRRGAAIVLPGFLAASSPAVLAVALLASWGAASVGILDRRAC